MSRSRYDIDYAVAQVQLGNAFRPMLESKESAHGRQIRRDDLYIWQRGELPVASVMIAVFMGVHDEQGKAYAVLDWQKGKDRLRQWQLVRIRDGASVNQRAFWDPMMR